MARFARPCSRLSCWPGPTISADSSSAVRRRRVPPGARLDPELAASALPSPAQPSPAPGHQEECYDNRGGGGQAPGAAPSHGARGPAKAPKDVASTASPTATCPGCARTGGDPDWLPTRYLSRARCRAATLCHSRWPCGGPPKGAEPWAEPSGPHSLHQPHGPLGDAVSRALSWTDPATQSLLKRGQSQNKCQTNFFFPNYKLT